MLQTAENVRFAPRTVGKYLVQIAIVFVAYFVAGKLGQATTNIRSSNLGPVWPAFGVALAGLLLCGYRVWVGIAAAAFIVAFSSPVPHLAALGQAFGATLAALAGAFLLRRIGNFQPSLARLRDVLALIAFGGLGSAMVSATLGVSVLYATHVQAYSGLGPAWLIYWLGDSTGVLLVTPLVLTAPDLRKIRSWARIGEFAELLLLLTATCFIVFGDLPLIPVKLHVLAFAVLPFVMWAAIRFGVAGTALSILVVATIATVETALGSGPFALNTPFTNAVLLDVFFAVLSVSGLTLAAAIAEREQGEREREELVRKQAAMEARLRLATIVESTDDAIVGGDMEGIVTDWNKGAEQLYGYSASEVIGKPISFLIPADRLDEFSEIMKKLRRREVVRHYETVRQRKDGTSFDVSLTISPIVDGEDRLLGVSAIVRDITQRKLAEAALASVSGRLIEAQEQERTRIARELHDDISQRLALLTVKLEDLRQDSPDLPEEVLGRVGELRDRASDIASDVQSLSHELHSSKLEHLGLVPAVRGVCREFSEQQKVDIDFKTADLPSSVPLSISLCLFRVVQEALHNSAKHSGVRRCEVHLWAASNEIHLKVRDSGVGFDSELAKQSGGIGLISMQERLKLLKGTLSIESQPNCGTTVYARVPLIAEGDSLRATG